MEGQTDHDALIPHPTNCPKYFCILQNATATVNILQLAIDRYLRNAGKTLDYKCVQEIFSDDDMLESWSRVRHNLLSSAVRDKTCGTTVNSRICCFRHGNHYIHHTVHATEGIPVGGKDLAAASTVHTDDNDSSPKLVVPKAG